MSFFGTVEVAKAAVEQNRAYIQKILLEQGENGIHIVISKPNEEIWIDEEEGGDTEGVLYEETVLRNGTTEWADQEDCIRYAHCKAMLASILGLNTGEILEQYPHLLGAGYILLQGGVYYKRLTVSVSGVKAEDDERIALRIAKSFVSLCAERLRTFMDENPNALFVTEVSAEEDDEE